MNAPFLVHPDALTALLVLPVALVLWMRSRLIITSKGRWTLGALRLLALALLVFALADPRIPREEKRETEGLVFVVDASASVDPARRRELLAELAGWLARRGDDRPLAVRLVHANRETVLVEQDAVELARDGDASLWTSSDQEGAVRRGAGASDLAGGVRRALGLFDGNTRLRIVLASDGNPNMGSMEEVLDVCRLRGVPVHTLLVPARPPDGVVVEGLDLPRRTWLGDSFKMIGRIRSRTTGSVKVRFYEDDELQANKTVRVEAGKVVTVEHEVTEDRVGPHRHRMVVSPVDVPDEEEENNVCLAFNETSVVPKVLVVLQDPREAGNFLSALRASKIRYEIKLAQDFPREFAGLLPYSAVVMVNVKGELFSPGQLVLIRRFVEDHGGGFAMIGGKRSYGMGGYFDTPVEQVLPVEMSPRSYSVSFGLVLLLDASGSMDGFPLEWVKTAAKKIIGLMRGKHLGVYFFNTTVGVAVRLQFIQGNRVLVEKDIDSIRASGGTAFAPALQAALQALENLEVANKRIILLSDGQPSDFPQIQTLYPHLNDADIKVSTVGIGNVNSFTLKHLAAKCDGKYYESKDLSRLPEIFEEEVRRLVGPPYVEAPVRPKLLVPTGILAPWAERAGEIPLLQGYLGTTPKARAEVLLASETGDPILAVWRYGLGRTLAFTSSVDGAWGRDWLTWKDFPTFWSRCVKDVVKRDRSDFKIRASVDGLEGRVVVDAVDGDGRYVNFLDLEAVVRDPGNDERTLVLASEGSGRYGVRFPLDRRGFYGVTLRRKEKGTMAELGTTTLALGYSPEMRFLPADRSRLEDWARRSGGRFLAAGVGELDGLLAEKDGGAARRATELWPWLLGLALLLFALEIALRRIGVFAVDSIDELEGGGNAKGDDAYRRIAEQYERMAREYEGKGDERQAQRAWQQARAFFRKAKLEERATMAWERYRHLDGGHTLH